MKRKRLLLAVALVTGMLGWNSAQAQNDVTSTYITNAGFEDCPAFGSGNAAAVSSAAGTNYAEYGWTLTKMSGWSNSAVFEYGSGGQINGATVPSKDPKGNAGKGLAFSQGWGGDNLYRSNAVTLPAGTYTLVAPVYNALEGVTQMTSKIGFVPTNGGSFISTRNSYAYNTWTLDMVEFTLTEPTEGQFQVGFQAISGGSGSNAKLIVDGLILYDGVYNAELIANKERLEGSSFTNPSADLLINGSFDAENSGWTLTNMGYQKNGERPTRYVEKWQGSALTGNGSATQTVKNLPAGAYILKGTVNTNKEENGGATLNVNNASTPVSGAWKEYEIIYNLEEDGDVAVAFNWSGLSSNWIAIDGFSLVYGGPYDRYMADKYKRDWDIAIAAAQAALENADYSNIIGAERTTLETEVSKTEPTTAEGYIEATEILNNAIAAFTAAKPNYEALLAEIAKATALGVDASGAQAVAEDATTTAASALAATQELKVAEYNYVTGTYQYAVELGTWKTTGPTGSLTEQHWSGEAHPYLEQSGAAWSQNSWTIKYEQDLALPAGNYVFKVAGRQANSDGVTLSLNVSNGGTVLGTVSDFPKGDTGRGIDTSGATNFSEGTYANNNAGRGWEWRYVKFTLDEDATVKVAVDAVATTNHMWVSFCDATVQTDNEANISLIEYNIALNDAKTAFNNETDYPAIAQYPNASENIALQEAIAADETLDKTNKEAIDAATETLKNATAAFIAANTNYQDALNALNEALAINPEDYPYADPNKTPTDLAAPTTAEGATQYAIDMRANYRKFVESHALAEGVEGAENKTDLIINPNYTDNTDAWGWTITQTGGNSNKSMEGQSFTDGDGKNDYHYYDYYNEANANQNVYQTVENVPAGRYLVTATMRGAVGLTYALNVTVDGTTYSTPVNTIGANGGIFGAGWNDYSAEFEVLKAGDVELRAKAGPGNGAGWTGVTRWRLVKIADIEYVDVEVTAGGELDDKFYATFSSDKNLDFSAVEGLTAYYVTSASKKELSITPAETVPAGTAVLLEGAEAKTYQVPVCSSAAEATNNQLQVSDGTVKGNGTSIFVLGAGKNGVGFYLKKKDSAIAAGKAYLEIEDDGTGETKSFISLSGDDATAISNVEAAQGTGIIYNLNGQRVAAPVKGGLYIMNGKKVLVK